MPRDGTGTFNRTDGERTGATIAQDQLSELIEVTASLYDTELQDIADAITGSLALDGQSTMSGDLKMGGNKIVNLADGTVAGDAIAYDQSDVRLEDTTEGAGVGGTLDLYRNSASPADADELYQILFSGENSGGGKKTYAELRARIDDATSGTEDGTLLLRAIAAGTVVTALEIGGTGMTAGVPIDMAGNLLDTNAGDITTGGGDIDTEGGDINLNGGALIGGTASPSPGALDLDGGDLTLDEDGDTVLSASSDDTVVLSIGPGPTTLMTMTASKVDLTSGAELDTNGGRLTLDADGDSYIDPSSDDELKFFAGGALRATISDAQMTMNTTLDMNGKNLVLDTAGNGRIDMATADRMDFHVAGDDKLQISGTLIEMLQNVDMNANDIDMAGGNLDMGGGTLDLATGDIDMEGGRIDLDADNDTSIRSPSDDQINFEIGGDANALVLTSGDLALNADTGEGSLTVTAAGTSQEALLILKATEDDSDPNSVIEIYAVQNSTDNASSNIGFRTRADGSLQTTAMIMKDHVLQVSSQAAATDGTLRVRNGLNDGISDMVSNRAGADNTNHINWYVRGSGVLNHRMTLANNGDCTCDGSFTGGGAADFAEMLEEVDGENLKVGEVVVAEGERVRRFRDGDKVDDIIGVVRPEGAAIVIGNAAAMGWQGMYRRDEFGRIMKTADGRDMYNPEYKVDPIAFDMTAKSDRQVKDPDYVPRAERPEWHIIGLIGLVAVLKGQPAHPRWIKRKSGEVADHYLAR